MTNNEKGIEKTIIFFKPKINTDVVTKLIKAFLEDVSNKKYTVAKDVAIKNIFFKLSSLYLFIIGKIRGNVTDNQKPV